MRITVRLIVINPAWKEALMTTPGLECLWADPTAVRVSVRPEHMPELIRRANNDPSSALAAIVGRLHFAACQLELFDPSWPVPISDVRTVAACDTEVVYGQ